MYYPLGSLFLFVLGSAIGSFLNVVIDRIPREESLNGRSHCDHCKKTLAPLDLVPVFSYVFLGGKCRYGGKRLSVQYPLIEALTGGLFVLVF
jgi:prepilin signal peptidase PulO-like enzyme (type II secretory pathway)